MTILFAVFRWLYDALRKSLSFLFTIPGIIASATTSVVTAVVTLFNGFTPWTDIVQWLNEATIHVSSLIANTSSVFQTLISFFALDRLAQILIVALASTIGVTVGIFITMFTSVIVLVPIVYGCKFAIRAIGIATSGAVKPY